MRLLPLPVVARRLTGGALLAVALGVGATMSAQIPGRNVNMVSGTDWPGGDPFLQRQNEPSLAASTRNPLHLVAGSNDYRTVDVPGLPDGAETGDAWLGLYKSFDGGQRWSSTLVPGYPQDLSAAGLASPIKGYQAAADPVLRAGTHGLIYYNGLVFDRGENGRSAIFVTRFIDRNDQENGDPVAYLGTNLVVQSTGDAFLDKPWMAVDLPRGPNPPQCIVGGSLTPGAKVRRNGHRHKGKGRGNQPPDDGYERVPAGAVYVVYSSITGDGDALQSQIYVKRSMDCGVTWSPALRVSNLTDRINQGATLSIEPQTGNLFVAWRRFASPEAPEADAIMVARLRVGAARFDAPGRARGLRRITPVREALDRIFERRRRRAGVTEAAAVAEMDQGTSPFSFRTNAYPAMAIDGAGRAYVAWSERGFAAGRPDATDGDARILVATTTNGADFSAPVVVDDRDQLGHQLMPSLSFAAGRLMLIYYDLRETRAGVFSRFVADDPATVTASNGVRQTIDIRASMGTPGALPSFAESVRVSDYLTGYRDSQGLLEPLQVNPPNLPMFRLGTVPFIGDYIDVAPAPAFVPAGAGTWAYNTAPSAEFPVFHAVWTDNRDVRPPNDGNWQNYTPPTRVLGPSDPPPSPESIFDPTQMVPVCVAGNAGSRNQNIYTARIGGGLLVGSPGNAKPLSPTLQRGFVVFAQNQTTTTRTFRLRVLAQPAGGRASFEQFPLPPYTAASPAPLTTLDVRVPARSTASRTLFVTSTDSKALVAVDVSEVAGVGGTLVPGGLTGRVLLNPDIENPDIENPDIENPDIENPDIENAEVYNPNDIENPDIENPDIENPDIENPDIENPDIENVIVANPDIENVGITNPDIENPDIENPDIENPDIENPDIENGTISDVTWAVSNTGNTTAAFNVNLFLAATTVPAGLTTQLVVYKTYTTPVTSPNGCELRVETRNVLITNVPNPLFVTAGSGVPSPNDPSETNATLWLAPGEIARITLRVYDPDRSNNLTYVNADGSTASIDPAFDPTSQVTPGISGQGVDVLDPPGATEPPIVTPTGSNLFFLQQPSAAAPDAAIVPTVSVRAFDNTGATLAGVIVTLSLEAPGGAALAGNVAMSDGNGVASFPALAVDTAGTYRLVAAASSPGVVATAVSNAFTIAEGSTPASVFITNWAAIHDGAPKPVTVTTVPPELDVEVTYTGSPTTPAAIGAYAVVATVTTPGYVGSASATQTIASTLSGGGPGGGPYGPLGCAPGVFANGLRVDTNENYALTSAQLLCADAGHPLPFGGATEPDLDMTCAVGEVMVGIAGTQAQVFGPPFDVVTSIGPRCQSLDGGAITQLGPFPGAGTPFGPFDCPAGQAVTGVVGGQGAVVDAVALVCGTPPQPPTITSVSPSTGAPNEGFLVLRGTNLPDPATSTAVVSNGDATINGFIFLGASSSSAYRVRLPTFPLGPATVQIQNGSTLTNAVPITVSTTPGTPAITGVYADLSPTTTVTPGGTIAVAADGIDTLGSMVRFQQGENVTDLSPGFTTANDTMGVAAVVAAPEGLTSGPVSVSIRQGASAFSTPVVLTVP